MVQKASVKAAGLLATKSVQELALLAQELVPQVLPAQSPQKVVSKTYVISHIGGGGLRGQEEKGDIRSADP